MNRLQTDLNLKSDLNKAIEIAKKSVLEFANEYSNEGNRKPTIRVKMSPSAMTLLIRFFAPIKIIQQITSDITKDVYYKIREEKDVEIAYPHSEIIFKNKNIHHIFFN